MSSLKDEAMKAFSKLPDDVGVDEMMYRLYVVDRIMRGEQDIAAGRVVSQEDLERQSQEW